MLKKNSWYANGKLLLTGEYLVMHGADALAVPLKYGQHLTVNQTDSDLLHWTANTFDGKWFETTFKLPSLEIRDTSDQRMARQLRMLLLNAVKQNRNFLASREGWKAETKLGFNPDFGFGSSSTLVYCVARWAEVDPFLLQAETFGGSGYDIACANANGPLVFKRTTNQHEIHEVEFSPPFKDNLYFVYLGKKQQTSGSIRKFRENAVFSSADINKITALTRAFHQTENLQDFEKLIVEHERIMSAILKTPTAKAKLFEGFEGAVKSLGAWGGDFVLVTGDRDRKKFIQQMKDRRFNIVYAFDELVLRRS